MTFIDQHPQQYAFVGNQIARLLDLIDAQSIDFLQDAGISLPSRAVSTVILINERGQISTADIAKELKQPHQLATQRVETLIDLGLIDRIADPDDRRRKILTLTEKGKEETAKLHKRLADGDRIFLRLFDEIECDLSAATLRAIDALQQSPIAARAKALKTEE